MSDQLARLLAQAQTPPAPQPPGMPSSQYPVYTSGPPIQAAQAIAAARAAANPQTAQAQGPASFVPYGPVAGTMTRNPLYDFLGATRPLGPGEHVTNTIGQQANEMDYNPPVAPYMVVPGLWMVNGIPTHVTEDQALALAKQSGLNFPTFPTQAQSDQFVNQREANWEKNPNTWSQPPLWSKP